MSFVFIVTCIIHGLIHLFGFVNAFRLAKMEDMASNLSKFEGLLWLISTLAFLSCALLFIFDIPEWSILTLGSIALSQVLIFRNWGDSKFGTLANLVLLLFLANDYYQWL